MARIKIVHATEYTYRNPVGLTRHRLMLRPDDSHDLRLHSADLNVEPQPASVRWKHDMFDNSICFLEWPETLKTERLTIVSTLDLTHHPDGQPLPEYSLDGPAEHFPLIGDRRSKSSDSRQSATEMRKPLMLRRPLRGPVQATPRPRSTRPPRADVRPDSGPPSCRQP